MDSASVTAGASSTARGVGSMPERVLTNSGSPSWRRSRPRALLIADCVNPTSPAARVTLPWRNSASNTGSRLRSGSSFTAIHNVDA